ncbi:MAG: alpha/beta fold hydrolase [Rhodobacteraceae bacterium]|nr:alpha/beta fold hydrolase [Paracoccaceae bacterium]
MSDTMLGNLTLDDWVADLRTVVEAAQMPRPFALLAMSQGAGAAAAYAARYPSDISHIIFLGGYARGAFRRGDAEQDALYRAVTEVFRLGFTQENPAFTDVFTSRFVPNGSAEHRRWFSDMCLRTTTPEAGARLLQARGEMDASGALPQVLAPTLVFHATGDQVVPIAEGQALSRDIPGAAFMPLASDNHVLQVDELAWGEFSRQMLDFLGAVPAAAEHAAAFDLTDREAAILSLICDAQSNKQIARTLNVSEKTVRNHATNIFAKLGVSTRQEAMLKAAGPKPG